MTAVVDWLLTLGQRFRYELILMALWLTGDLT